MKTAAAPRKRTPSSKPAKGAASRKRSAKALLPDPKRVADDVLTLRTLVSSTNNHEVQELADKATTLIETNNRIAMRRLAQCRADSLEYMHRYFARMEKRCMDNAQQCLQSVQAEQQRFESARKQVREQLATLNGDDPRVNDKLMQCFRLLDTNQFEVMVPCRTMLRSAKTPKAACDDCDDMDDVLSTKYDEQFCHDEWSENYRDNDDSDDEDDDCEDFPDAVEPFNKKHLLRECSKDLASELEPLDEDRAARLLDAEALAPPNDDSSTH